MTNKKGVAFADILPLIVTIIVFAVVFTFVGCSASQQKEASDRKLTEGFLDAETDDMLLEYLYAPVTFDGRQATLADLIVAAYYQPTSRQRSLLEQETEKLLNQFSERGVRSDYSLEITADEFDGFSFQSLGYGRDYLNAYQAKVVLPTMYHPLTVTLNRRHGSINIEQYRFTK